MIYTHVCINNHQNHIQDLQGPPTDLGFVHTLDRHFQNLERETGRGSVIIAIVVMTIMILVTVVIPDGRMI